MIRVQLLGRFSMYDETRCLNEEAIHSPMITKLLVYMICNKNHIVTLEQLTEALWTDEESENPYGALKNMMYRLRGRYGRLREDHACYMKAVMELTKSLEHRRAYEKLEEICRRAVRMDPQEETVYYRFYTADRKGKVQVLSDLKELYQELRELEKIN